MWKPGTIVMCVDDNWHPAHYPASHYPRLPANGDLLAVREHGVCECGCGRGCVTFMETDAFWGFHPHHFRKMESEHSEAGSVRKAEPVGA